jgi:hypothetical protein
MSHGELRAWEANAAALHAEEVLRDRGGSLDPDQLRHYTLLATGDATRADKACARRWLEMNRKG